MGFVVIEKSFLLPHPDLPRIAVLYGQTRSDAFAEPDHGTATLGIIASLDDGAGTVGIVPAATPRVAAIWPGESEIAIALIVGAAALNRGGVLVLGTQSAAKLPSETNDLIFHAIHLAVAARRAVVEDAGDGGVDLDTLRRGDAAFLDSGAILVGGCADERRVRTPTSNYGARIDCYAWAGGVATTYPPYGYAYAAGTAAATAVVAGAAIALQAMYKCRFGTALDPGPLRDILARTGTQAAAADQGIGVMPDLRAAFHAIQTKSPTAPPRAKPAAVLC